MKVDGKLQPGTNTARLRLGGGENDPALVVVSIVLTQMEVFTLFG